MAGPQPGSRLDRWYRRTPEEIAAEKARNSQARHAAFFAARADDREPEFQARNTAAPNRASLPRTAETPYPQQPRGAAPRATGREPGATSGADPRELQNEMLRQYPSAAADFALNWKDMVEADTIGADRYFHCKANCQAARRGDFGDFAAERLSNGREIVQQRFQGESRADAESDQEANHWGRDQAHRRPPQACGASCARFRPKALDSRYD